MKENEVHPMLAIDQSEFAKNFNMSALLAKVALGVASALVVREILKQWDKFIAKKGSRA